MIKKNKLKRSAAKSDDDTIAVKGMVGFSLTLLLMCMPMGDGFDLWLASNVASELMRAIIGATWAAGFCGLGMWLTLKWIRVRGGDEFSARTY